MGVLAPGSAHARPSAHPPIHTSGNFPARLSAEWSSNNSIGEKEYNRPAPLCSVRCQQEETEKYAKSGLQASPPAPQKTYFFRGRGVGGGKFFKKIS